MNENRIIGDGKNLLWNLPGDLKRLKKITMGSPLIMGRKTWDSIGRPLPGRANIVLTKSISWRADGAIVVNSFEDAITKADLKAFDVSFDAINYFQQKRGCTGWLKPESNTETSYDRVDSGKSKASFSFRLL